MQKRTFLTALGCLPLAGLNQAWAQPVAGMDHSQHGMATPAKPAQNTMALAPVSALPAGAPLATLTKLASNSTTPGTFKATLTAAPVTLPLIAAGPTELWAYNASLPGPLIEVFEGDTVEILFINHLPQPSTIHWHGLPVPSEQDGNPQDAVEPGAQRVYKFTLPKGCAGTYWYHPHPHGFTAEQVYRGLAGTFIVRAKDDPLQHVPERLLVCSDLKLTSDGRIAQSDANDEMDGREGQFALINGQRQPVLKFAAGGRERWRIWNANNARFLRLSLPGATLTLVGTDGGLLEKPVSGLTELLLAPAQRVELIVDAPAKPARIALQARVYARGKMGNAPPDQALPLLLVDFGATHSQPLPALPAKLRTIASLGAVKAKKRVVFSEKMSMAGGVHSMKFLVNNRQFDMDRIDLTSRAGEVELWEVANESDMDHPFHIHGTQFQVIESVLDGKTTPAPYRAWRDTVNLRSGETVRLKMVQHFKGLRMYHCHILEHENAGMMGQLKVI
jgi:bilirubin oxidase